MVEVRGDELLPKGWKVEVRVRKSGRKDRYYTDPASGYIFRSLKDIDRYLLTGKFGRRRPMRSKHNDVGGGSNPNADEAPAVVEKQNYHRNENKKPASGGCTNSNQKLKNRKISKSPDRKSSDDFFIQDSDQGANVSNEIIELMKESEDSRKSTYLSAPEIAVLIGRRAPNENDFIVDHKECQNPIVAPHLDICSDPCIEFAIKTLTGAIPLERVGDFQKGTYTATNEECSDLFQGKN